LGVNGGFGGLISRLLMKEEKVIVIGVDLNDQPAPTSRCSKYIGSNVTVIDNALVLMIRETDIIIICLPETIAYKFLDQYKRHLSKKSLLIDTLSVKEKVASIYEENDFTGLSLNPMFGPDLSIEGKNIVVVKFKHLPASDWFVSLLGLWKLNIVYTTAEDHDKMTSILQVAAHAAIMAFGMTLNNSDVPLNRLLEIATPPFVTLSTLSGRILSGNKKVYWDIQNENPFASEARQALIKNLTLLNNSVEDGLEDDFNKLITPRTDETLEIFRKLSAYFSIQLSSKTPDL
jgi:prephenate dehydrogenase